MIAHVNLSMLRLWRMHTATRLFGPFRRITLSEIGEHWGEGEWTARDLWR